MKRLELLVEAGALSGKRYEVTEVGLRLGRSSSCDISVPDEGLSRTHCLFEQDGERWIRVTDLASSNGTFVNGRQFGDEAVRLREGDTIEVGDTVLRAIDPERKEEPKAQVPAEEPKPVDLGLGSKEGEISSSGTTVGGSRSPIVNILWAVAVAVALAAIGVVLMMPKAEEPQKTVMPAETEPTVCEVSYEKVEADGKGIFRYALEVARDGTIRVQVDDTGENRRPTIPPRKLDEAAMKELNEILPFKAVEGLVDAEGPEPEVQKFTSWRLKVVYDRAVRSVKIVNSEEPEGFRKIREKLETFSKNELGIHAIQYSRERLIQFAVESIAVGKAKWEDRDVQYGNLHGSMMAYKEALFYLETIDPKPDCVVEAREGLDRAKLELDKRYKDQRFLADKAINMSQWETAQGELKTLLEMVPDRRDDRNREAAAKLLDVEKRMKGGK